MPGLHNPHQPKDPEKCLREAARALRQGVAVAKHEALWLSFAFEGFLAGRGDVSKLLGLRSPPRKRNGALEKRNQLIRSVGAELKGSPYVRAGELVAIISGRSPAPSTIAQETILHLREFTVPSSQRQCFRILNLTDT